ncbi:hypothetical protein F2P79_025734, partial [Pimephales promelas]
MSAQLLESSTLFPWITWNGTSERGSSVDRVILASGKRCVALIATSLITGATRPFMALKSFVP